MVWKSKAGSADIEGSGSQNHRTQSISTVLSLADRVETESWDLPLAIPSGRIPMAWFWPSNKMLSNFMILGTGWGLNKGWALPVALNWGQLWVGELTSSGRSGTERGGGWVWQQSGQKFGLWISYHQSPSGGIFMALRLTFSPWSYRDFDLSAKLYGLQFSYLQKVLERFLENAVMSGILYSSFFLHFPAKMNNVSSSQKIICVGFFLNFFLG